MLTNAQRTRKWKKAINFVNKNFPTHSNRTVHISLVKELKGFHGYVEFDDEGDVKHAHIQIVEDDLHMMIETLIEEWVHILRQDTPVPLEKDHDSIFWAIYGTVMMAWRGGE